MLDTKGDGFVGCSGFSNMTNSDRLSNGCNGDEVWSIERWSARSTMVSVAVEKIGGLFLPMGRTRGT